MNKSMASSIASILILSGVAIFAYLHWKEIPVRVGSFDLGDLTNIATLLVAIFSLWVALAAYQKSVRDSEEQQKSLDASRTQLQAVVDAATMQQDIMSKNLETSKVQQEILTKNLETSKAQLHLLEEQWKREQERQARKPKLEITFNGLSQKNLRDKFPLPLSLQPNRTATLTFVVTNLGNSSVLNPLISAFVSPQVVRVDSRGGVYET